MVIGEQFAWAHLPKTGGDATLSLFQLFPELIVSADPSDTNDKHDLFRDREPEIQGKLLAMNIRRLPSWMLSRAHYRARHGIYPDYRPLPMPSPHEMAHSSAADERLNDFTDDGRFKIDRWIRLEFVVEDFLDFISAFSEVTEEKRSRALELGKVNQLDYDRELSHWFSFEQMERIYESNPLWSALEKRVYGEIALDAVAV